MGKPKPNKPKPPPSGRTNCASCIVATVFLIFVIIVILIVYFTLLYAGSQVGFMYIPAGKVNAGGSQYMAASFAVQSFPLFTNQPMTYGDRVQVGNGGSGSDLAYLYPPSLC
ncbi:OLC1v1030051C1 [Oldenlandia corymbosa var. corymbosa]|uniref:OLC1v1030051C1 n=1 Tax=Oldenlandia corymbosa var. corymbosa TaxID=529605 RepID=A0AAV1CH11_OLDCO|nr:OLC1v1030051C1 [Oldenlandia corymbosa var. corymbosa]